MGDLIENAIAKAEEKEAAAAAEPEAIAVVTLTFLSNGGIMFGSAGDPKPALLWAGSGFLRAIADDRFTESVAANRQNAAKAQPRIFVPGSDMGRIG